MSTTAESSSQYGLTREQLDFLEVIRQMAVEKVAPRAAEIDETGEFPQDIRELFAESRPVRAAVRGAVRRYRNRRPHALRGSRGDSPRYAPHRP